MMDPQAFHQRHWERSACADATGLGLAQVDAGLVFEAVVAACEHYIEHGRPAVGNIRAIDGDGAVMLGPEHRGRFHCRLPRAAQIDWEGYAQQQAQPFLLQLSHLHRQHAGLGAAIESFVRQLVAASGLPTRGFWVDCYVGRYDQTPFGVHLDGNSNFTLGVFGHKDIYLWEPKSYWEHCGKAGDFELPEHGPQRESMLAQAHRLAVDPGRLVYWPSRYWHVAEPGPGLSVTLNVAAYWQDGSGLVTRRPAPSGLPSYRVDYARNLHQPLALLGAFEDRIGPAALTELERVAREQVVGALATEGPAIDQRPRVSTPPIVSSGEPIALPQTLVEVVDDAQRWADGCRRDTIEAWLSRVSSAGLGPTVLVPIPHADIDAVVCSPVAGALCWVEHGDEVFVAARGHVSHAESTPALCRLLRRLAKPEPFAMAWLMREHPLDQPLGTHARATAADLVRLLATWGAVRLEAAADRPRARHDADHRLGRSGA
ncbi:MAG: hypothetical protein K0V04_35575 [Deltaproteobacteria bacterium]|nr:hypothetical protein [Deltaproteobacteria bacterium]